MDLRSKSLVAAMGWEMDVRSSVVDFVWPVVELPSILGCGVFTLDVGTGSDLTPQSRRNFSDGNRSGMGQIGKAKLSANAGDAKSSGRNPASLVVKLEEKLVRYLTFGIAKLNINPPGI
jgi:hypothetical protein